jgi:Ca2+-dependent lipid-binding protein
MKYVVYNYGARTEFNDLVPIGLLKLTIHSAKNLKVADLLTSDPYVQIKFMDKIEQTKIIYKTLNPVWSVIFSLILGLS